LIERRLRRLICADVPYAHAGIAKLDRFGGHRLGIGSCRVLRAGTGACFLIRIFLIRIATCPSGSTLICGIRPGVAARWLDDGRPVPLLYLARIRCLHVLGRWPGSRAEPDSIGDFTRHYRTIRYI
jgi:hypothetical protein